MMEMNGKTSFVWDWENLVVLNTKTIQTPNKLTNVDSEFEGFELGSYFSGGTRFDLGYASSSRSSKSASVESSPDKEAKQDGITQTSSIIESLVGSGESLIALELGKRTYFEDVTAVNKSKLSTSHTYVPRCQVEGCNINLSTAKDYHRKHKVCENHSKSPRVVINGVEKRFCQQCSRFHGLMEFDQTKRSCRRRLSNHNARRRKPKPEVIQFNSTRLTPLLCEGRNQLTFGFDHGSVLETQCDVWDGTTNPKVGVTKPSLLTPKKQGYSNESHSTHIALQIPNTKVSNVSTHLLPSKASSFEAYHRGTTISVKPTNMEPSQDQQRALSLLSTSRDSCEPSLSHPFPMTITHTQAQPHPPPGSTTHYWHVEEPPSTGLGPHGLTFQLSKALDDSAFYLY